jgi:glycerol-3-phosphate dehydrogenase
VRSRSIGSTSCFSSGRRRRRRDQQGQHGHLHTGFDTKPGTLESRLVRRGYALLSAYGPAAGIPIERLGALLVAWDAEQAARLPTSRPTPGRRDTRTHGPITLPDLARLEPHLGPGATGALAIPGRGHHLSLHDALAFATEAVLNGTTLLLDRRRRAACSRGGTTHVLATARGAVHADWVVNAAGLASDAIDRLFGHDDFTVTPRRGELIVYDKLARPLVRHVLLPVPTARTKGVLVSPTVFGNVRASGPTADDVADKRATASTPAGLARLVAQGRRLVPALVAEEVTAVYVGLRAATGARRLPDPLPSRRSATCCVGGIRFDRAHGIDGDRRSTCSRVLRDAGLKLGPARRRAHRPHAEPRRGERAPVSIRRRLIARDPGYGAIVCHCERVTRG